MLVLVLKAGVRILIDALRVLLDASIDFETMDPVKTIILKDPHVLSINSLWGRDSGRFKFIEADIVVRAKNLDRAHFISRGIEEKIIRMVNLACQSEHIKGQDELKSRYCIFSILFIFNHCINEGVPLPTRNSIVPYRLLLSYKIQQHIANKSSIDEMA